MVNFDLNKFFEKGSMLKYIALIACIFLGIYWLDIQQGQLIKTSKKDSAETAEKVSQEAASNFKSFASDINAKLDNLTAAQRATNYNIEALRLSTSQKFNVIIQRTDKNSEDIIQMIQLIDESYNNIHNIYSIHLDTLKKTNMELARELEEYNYIFEQERENFYKKYKFN